MKKKITSEEVKHVVDLAKLTVKPEKLKKYSQQLSEVIDFNISHLKKINTSSVEPTAHVSGAANILRSDDPEPGLTSQEALQNAKETHNGFFKVKAILDQ